MSRKSLYIRHLKDERMKFRRLFAFILFAGIINPLYARLFFIGSNPHTSRIAFPQDVLLVPYSYVAYRMAYQWGPHYGNPEDPFGKPNSSYATSSEDISFAQEEGEAEKAGFNKEGSTSVQQHTLMYQHIWNDKTTSLFSLTYKNLNAQSSFNGNLQAELDDGTYQYVDVDSSTSSTSQMAYTEAITAFRHLGFPAGIKIGYGREWKDKPKADTNAAVNGMSIDSDRILWGWSASGCNHIFGYKHITADAWFYNNYTAGHIDQFDIQLGATTGRFKSAVRYRLRSGIEEQYSWKSDSTYEADELSQEETLDTNFNGSYEKNDIARKSIQHIGRVYSNITFLESQYFKFNTLFFVGADIHESEHVSSSDYEIANDVKESCKTLLLEANPNVNIYPGKYTTIDAAILSEFGISKYENTFEKGTGGGSKETYINSSPYVGDEPWWENFSYADEHFLDLGAEINAYLPLYGNKEQSLGCSVILLYNNKFTWNTKHYGQNPETGDSFSFDKSHKRETYKRETWFNTAVGFTYRHKKIIAQFSYAQPLIYKRYVETSVKEGGETLFSHSSTFEPGIQQGASASGRPEQFGTQMVSFMVAYAL